MTNDELISIMADAYNDKVEYRQSLFNFCWIASMKAALEVAIPVIEKRERDRCLKVIDRYAADHDDLVKKYEDVVPKETEVMARRSDIIKMISHLIKQDI
jgi:RAB protein geranylgeranyltransferase component A